MCELINIPAQHILDLKKNSKATCHFQRKCADITGSLYHYSYRDENLAITEKFVVSQKASDKMFVHSVCPLFFLLATIIKSIFLKHNIL